MSNNIEQQIFALLDKVNYRVSVVPTEDGCVAMFPDRAELPFLAFRQLHQTFTPEGVRIELRDNDGEIAQEALLPCPQYALRTTPLYYIIYWCQVIGYDFSAVKFVKDDKTLNEHEFLQEFNCNLMEAGDSILETSLMQLCSQAIHLGFNHPHINQAAVNLGLQEGFGTVKTIFSSGVAENILEKARNTT